VIVTVKGVASTPNANDKFTYVTPVVTETTVRMTVPPLPKGNGFWFTFTSNASGRLSAFWDRPASLQGTLAIYAGNPFAGRTNPVKLSPPANALAQDSGRKLSFGAATSTAQPAGQYTVYFFSSSSATASSLGSVTYMK